MKIQAYQFIKYNNSTLKEHLEKVNRTEAVICFDFEDGVINPLEMESTAANKEKAREQFVRLFSLIQDLATNTKVGVRINHCNSAEFEKDLLVMTDKCFDSIFIPKIENSEDIQYVTKKLDEYRIRYDNLIPILESHQGLINLETILQANPMIRTIGFGHCDYNLSIGVYPFFHQDSWEYWKWVAELESIIDKYNVLLINSAFLSFNNEDLFCSMLDYISNTKICFQGQFTLTNRQSELCNCPKTTTKKFRRLLENMNLISADKQMALNLVRDFEINNQGKALSKCENKFISLQEYLAAKKLITEQSPSKEMCFIGGCFPVQHDLMYENLFHQTLKREIETNSENKLNINIIRYERFATLLDKIDKLANQKKLDLIIFHIRPEPYLRLVKLLYKYLDDKGKLKWSLNFPGCGIVKSEEYDMLDLGRIFHIQTRRDKSLFRRCLISCNYFLGKLIGNQAFALKSYWETTSKIIDYCEKKNIKYIILGPNRRSNNTLEPILCKKLDLFFSTKMNLNYYVSGFENDNKAKMNKSNGIHVTQEYHDLIANKLYRTIDLQNYLR